jgi:UDP-glucose 4-epimerase
LLDSVRASGRQPVVVFPSSAAVYGNPRELPVDESAPCAPLSPYGFHKQACELLAREYASCFGLRVVVARLFSIFGPGQRRLLVWDLFRRLAANPATVSLDGTGAESRDYLHVDDAMRALLALTGVDTPAGAVLVTNVASGEETPIRELALVVREMLGSGSDVVWSGRSRAGDPVRWCADTRHLGELLPGWRPEPLRAGLRRCIDAWEGDRP